MCLNHVNNSCCIVLVGATSAGRHVAQFVDGNTIDLDTSIDLDTFNNSCYDCGQVFPSLYLLRLHTNNMHNYFDVCRLCNVRFKSESGFNFHLKMHKGTTPVCEICGKCVQSKAHLRRHMMRHEVSKDFECPLCDKKYKHKFDRDRHTRICIKNDNML